jgi:hypothetical protein
MSSDSRRDIRAKPVAAAEIKDYTTRESILQPIICADLFDRGFSCRVVDNGVDNTGEWIEGDLKNNNPDVKIFFDSLGQEEPIDIVSGGDELHDHGLKQSRTCTFKQNKFDMCVQHRASLLVYRHADYYVFSRDAMDKWATKFPAKPHKGFGNKMCHIGDWDYADQLVAEKLAVRNEWSPSAKNLIAQYQDALFKPRKKINRAW